ncbi:MAG: hypothetical protein ACK2UR_20260 [Candidatus Promineifilaceae bacterium]|jgi:type II restriction/modification system DNA methylase subunit YeeA
MDTQDFHKLHYKSKQQATLYKNVPAARPFVDAESKSTVSLDKSLGWNEEAFKGFVKELAGLVRGLSDLVAVNNKYAPTYRELSERNQWTDDLIDEIVYKLYGLTEEEIAIVEGTI